MLKLLFPSVLALGLVVTTGCFDSGGGGGGSGGDTALSANDGAFTGFLWKPKSESTGRLVVIFPTQYRGQHAGAAVHSGNPPRQSNKIEDGTFHTESHNGNRVHYRFTRPGSGYGNNVYATLYLKDGSTVSYFIPTGAGRHD